MILSSHLQGPDNRMNSILKAIKKFTAPKKLSGNRGLLIYETVNDVIHAESILKKASFERITIIAPPPEYRTGCDLSIEFDLIEQVSILRALKQHDLEPVDVLNISTEQLKPTELCTVKELGEYTMVRAANMKITFEKKSLKIVNISGGGCSDVPYLAQEMIGKRITETRSPKEIGYTLCAYTLSIAFEKAKEISK